MINNLFECGLRLEVCSDFVFFIVWLEDWGFYNRRVKVNNIFESYFDMRIRIFFYFFFLGINCNVYIYSEDGYIILFFYFRDYFFGMNCKWIIYM